MVRRQDQTPDHRYQRPGVLVVEPDRTWEEPPDRHAGTDDPFDQVLDRAAARSTSVRSSLPSRSIHTRPDGGRRTYLLIAADAAGI